jgi:DNA invertase Pin-like site-specific DNA recombinase
MKGWILDEGLKLHDLGVSAFRGQNAATDHLAAFREAIRLGKVLPGDVLLVESLDRLSREDIDPAWELFRSTLKSGVEIYTREPERHYLPADLSNFGTRIEVQAYMLRAYNESATKSMRGKSYWAAMRDLMVNKRKPIHKVLPAWLRLSPDRQRFEIIPEAAKSIKLIFQWAGEGMGINPVTARLNREGIKPIGQANSWRHSYVAKLLQDKTVIGHYQPHVMKMVPLDPKNPDGPAIHRRVPQGDPIPDYFPQIITEKQWYAVREAVKQRGKTRGRSGAGIASLFTGLLHDARDGQVMHLAYAGSSRKSNTRILLSYGCRNGEPGSVRLPFPYDAVERAFLASVKELKPADILGGKVDDREQEIAALSGKLHELDMKIATIQQRVMDEEGIDALVVLLEKLDKEKKTTAAKLDRLKGETSHQQPEVLGETQTLIDLLQKAQGEERKELRTRLKGRISRLVAGIWVLVWDVSSSIRAVEVQIIFHSGKVRLLHLAWLRRGSKHRGLVTGIGGVLVDEKGKGANLTDKRLSNYRTDPGTLAFFDQHLANLEPAIQAVIQAEIELRESISRREEFKRTGVVPAKDRKHILAEMDE